VKPVTQALTATKGASPETEEVRRGKRGFVAKQFPMVAAAAPFAVIAPGPRWRPRHSIDDTPEVPDVAPPAA
jgi:hypothetical protein